MLQLFCLACCSFAGEIPAGDPLTIPPFDAPFGQQRVAACVDASTSHAIGTANNTRWTFVGVPQGTPPPGGFPIFLSLLPWPDTPENTNVTAFGDGTCGNGWTPNGFFGQSCMRLMKDHCPSNLKPDAARCNSCVHNVSRQFKTWKQANCSLYPLVQRAWCGHQVLDQRYQYQLSAQK